MARQRSYCARAADETPSTGERVGFSSREEFMEALVRRLFVEEADDDSAKSGWNMNWTDGGKRV